MSETSPEPGSGTGGKAAENAPRRRHAFAEQELRLISSLVLLLAIGLVLALPFVLSIGAVVFLPLVAAIILTIILSPLTDRISALGLSNIRASLISMLVLLGFVLLAVYAIMRPAVTLFDRVPEMVERIGEHFS